MQLIVSAQVFSLALHSDDYHMRLLELLMVCRNTGHRIQTNPVWSEDGDSNGRLAPIFDWLKLLGDRDRKLIHSMLQADLPDQQTRHKLKIWVGGDADSCWKHRRLTLQDAKMLVRMPLRLLVENVDNDTAFLLALAPPPWRGELEKCIQSQWIQSEQGGGIDEIFKRLEERVDGANTHDNYARLRTWVMCDRDVDDTSVHWPPAPSPKSQKIRTLCERGEIPFWQLSRRNAENYLPLETLEAMPRPEVREHKWSEALRTLRELRSSTVSLQCYYSMTEGLLKDSKLIKAERDSCRRGIRTFEPDVDLRDFVKALSLTHAQYNALLEGFQGLKKSVYKGIFRTSEWEQQFTEEYERGPTDQLSRVEIVESILDWM